MEQNRRQAMAAAFSAAAASLMPRIGGGGEAGSDHVTLTWETHGGCRVFDANGNEVDNSLCVSANVTTGETRYVVKGDDGYMKGLWLDDGTRFEPDLETRWHPAPLRWEPMPGGVTP
jgi:hypothetical protein